jgi:primosomal protein N' (replication factor Y)
MSQHHSQPANPKVLKVALPVPLRQLFDYLPPDHGPVPPAGTRVVVPFGSRQLVGIVTQSQADTQLTAGRLLPIIEVLDQGRAVLDADLLELMQWCWQYYKHAPGDVLQAALPPALRKRQAVLPEAPLHYFLTPLGRERLEQGAGKARAQFALLQQLQDGPQLADELKILGDRWRPTLKRVIEQGWAGSGPLPAQVAPAAGGVASKARSHNKVAQAGPAANGPELTLEQAQAIEAIQAAGQGFSCHLLDGVTGSGKTEVYLRLLQPILQAGGQALVLVPEIGLTPQLIRRFQQRLGFRPAVLHSGLSEGERLIAWESVRTGRARLLIGTRSALFTPMPELAFIVLDEEHDASFKQQDGFRYSARDVAVKRASHLGIPVVLGSATPSLESINNAHAGRYQRHRLRQRATRATMPAWRVLDMRQQMTVNGLATAAIEAIAATLARGEQAMVFLNRRGYAPVLMCGQCGWHGQCQRCAANMTWHRSQRRLSCHHCGNEKPVPRLCPECRADALVGIGEGTQQLEAALSQRFPETVIRRFDTDSMRGKGVLENQLAEVRSGEPCILVGTQMLAKGHHFPEVTLVVVVNVDQALYSADYRALERLGQTLLQVAGRAGRANKPGSVLLQTYEPGSQALALLITQGYEAYSEWLLQDRQLAGLPPLSFQAQLKAEAVALEDVRGFLQSAAKCFPQGRATLSGPVPALMEKIAGRYRMYLLAQASSRADLHHQLDDWLEQLSSLPGARKVRWALDVDPQEM